MNKQELINVSSAKSGLTKKDQQKALEALILTIEETVATEEVRLVGFGVFDSRDVAEKSGVCKLQGVEKEWTTEAHKKPTFKAGSDFKLKVKTGNAE